MPNTQDQSTSANKWQGILLMGTAAALFPIKDGFIKALSGSISAIEAALIYFSVQALISFVWLRLQQRQNKKHRYPFKLTPLLVLRSTIQILAIVLFFYSIQHAPLAEAVVLFSSNALFVILISFLFFRTSTDSTVVVTALIGFLGVVIVLGPSIWKLGNFHLFFALMSAISFAFYLILTEKLGKLYPPQQMLLFDGVCGITLTTLCLVVVNGLNLSNGFYVGISGLDWLFLFASGTIGTCSALLIILAMQRAPAPLIAPLGYIEIVSAAAIGVYFFNESIYTSTVIGCMIIIASSWYSGVLATKLES